MRSACKRCCLQNNAIDIYQEYFAGFAADHSAEAPSAKTIAVFKDPAAIKRSVSSVHWLPDSGTKAVVAYSILDFQQQPAGMSLSSYVWDLGNPNVPDAELLAPSQLVTAKFNVKDGNIVGAGQYNGQFTCFDTRKGISPVDSTPMDICHRWVARSCCCDNVSLVAPYATGGGLGHCCTW
jgi:dynein intermediate chain 2